MLPSREDPLVSAERAVAQQDSLQGGQVCSSHPTPQPTVESDVQSGVEAVITHMELLQLWQGYASTSRATATDQREGGRVVEVVGVILDVANRERPKRGQV